MTLDKMWKRIEKSGRREDIFKKIFKKSWKTERSLVEDIGKDENKLEERMKSMREDFKKIEEVTEVLKSRESWWERRQRN